MLFITLDAETSSLNGDNTGYSNVEVTDTCSRDHIYKSLGTKVYDMYIPHRKEKHTVDKYGKLKQCQI